MHCESNGELSFAGCLKLCQKKTILVCFIKPPIEIDFMIWILCHGCQSSDASWGCHHCYIVAITYQLCRVSHSGEFTCFTNIKRDRLFSYALWSHVSYKVSRGGPLISVCGSTTFHRPMTPQHPLPLPPITPLASPTTSDTLMSPPFTDLWHPHTPTPPTTKHPTSPYLQPLTHATPVRGASLLEYGSICVEIWMLCTLGHQKLYTLAGMGIYLHAVC